MNTCDLCERDFDTLFWRIELISKAKRDISYSNDSKRILKVYKACSLTCLKKLLEEKCEEILVSLL